jgi:hypothetical protein
MAGAGSIGSYLLRVCTQVHPPPGRPTTDWSFGSHACCVRKIWVGWNGKVGLAKSTPYYPLSKALLPSTQSPITQGSKVQGSKVQGSKVPNPKVPKLQSPITQTPRFQSSKAPRFQSSITQTPRFQGSKLQGSIVPKLQGPKALLFQVLRFYCSRFYCSGYSYSSISVFLSFSIGDFLNGFLENL